MKVAGIVLSAGRSSRLGFPKALAELDGVSFVERALDALTRGGCTDVCVVVGPPHEALVRAKLGGVAVVDNPEPERGMASSLQVALARVLRDESVGAVVFSLVDHPCVRADTIAALIACFSARADFALRPTFEGRGGHPVLLSRGAAEALASAGAARSVRDVLGSELRDLPVDDPGVIDDVDAPEELARILATRPPRR